MSISCLLIVSFFHVPLLVRRHTFSLIVVIFIACRCLSLFARNVFRDRCNEGGIDSQRMENVTPGRSVAPISPRRTKSHIHPSQWKMTLNFLPCAYLARKKKQYLHVPSIRVLRAMSPVNADTGAHYTTSPSYVNCEPP